LNRKHFFQSLMGVGIFLLMVVHGHTAEFDLNLSSETLLRTFEREDVNGESHHVIPVYEYLSLDIGAPEESPFSMHVHGWGRHDFGQTDYYEEESTGELLYGYIEYQPFFSGLVATLGRKHFFSGVVNDSLDGLGVEYASPYFELSTFAGYPAAFEEDGRSGDTFVGGRVAVRLPLVFEFGASYKNISNKNDIEENLVGVDMSLDLDATLNLSGMSVWNLETDNWREHVYEADWILEAIHFTPFYHLFYYEDYFTADDNDLHPFRFLKDSGEELTVAGGDIIWQEFSRIDLGLRYKQYTYDLRSEKSEYKAALINLYAGDSSVYGVELGVMEGETTENNYLLGRVYFFWNNPFAKDAGYFLSGDAVYVGYEEKIYDIDQSLFLSLGVGKEVVPDELRIKMAADYSSDPYYDADIAISVVIQYEF
jgi:hypothetical protein